MEVSVTTSLLQNATPEGGIKAAHCLAKLGAKADPQICFPGQRAYEVVKPLVELLHPDIEGKPNYDAIITLTNLAAQSDSIRQRIIKEKVSDQRLCCTSFCHFQC